MEKLRMTKSLLTIRSLVSTYLVNLLRNLAIKENRNENSQKSTKLFKIAKRLENNQLTIKGAIASLKNLTTVKCFENLKNTYIFWKKHEKVLMTK